MTKSRKALRGLVEGALFVAVAQILSMIKLWEMPWGGSVVLAMVPLILYSVRWGLGSGLAACFVFGVLQFLFDGGFAIGWQSILGDYLIAFTALGFAGLFRGQRYGIFTGAVVGGLAPRAIQNLRKRYDTLFFLVPGYGAQGGRAKDVQYAFDQFGHGAIVNSSRGIMCAWQKIEGSDGRDYQEAARNEAIRMRDDICRFVKIL